MSHLLSRAVLIAEPDLAAITHTTTTTEKVTGILNFQNRDTGNMGENPRVIACGEIKAADHSSKPNFG